MTVAALATLGLIITTAEEPKVSDACQKELKKFEGKATKVAVSGQ